jgi:hypothetical protein
VCFCEWGQQHEQQQVQDQQQQLWNGVLWGFLHGMPAASSRLGWRMARCMLLQRQQQVHGVVQNLYWTVTAFFVWPVPADVK